MKGGSILNEHRQLSSGLPMLIGTFDLRVHHRQVPLTVEATYDHAIVKALLRLP